MSLLIFISHRKTAANLWLQSNIKRCCLHKVFNAYLIPLNRRPRSIWFKLASILVSDGASPKIYFNKSKCFNTIFPLPLLVPLIRPLENFRLISFTFSWRYSGARSWSTITKFVASGPKYFVTFFSHFSLQRSCSVPQIFFLCSQHYSSCFKKEVNLTSFGKSTWMSFL